MTSRKRESGLTSRASVCSEGKFLFFLWKSPSGEAASLALSRRLSLPDGFLGEAPVNNLALVCWCPSYVAHPHLDAGLNSCAGSGSLLLFCSRLSGLVSIKGLIAAPCDRWSGGPPLMGLQLGYTKYGVWPRSPCLGVWFS